MKETYWRPVLGLVFGICLLAAVGRLVWNPPASSAGLVSLSLLSGCALVVVMVEPRLTDFALTAKGIEGKLSKIDSKVETATQQAETTKQLVETQADTVREQGEQIRRQRDMLDDLIKYGLSASIFRHLWGVALLPEYKYHHGDSSQREMYFLRDNGYIRPKVDHFLDFNQAMNGRNLVEVADVTPIGRDLVKMRANEIPPEMLRDSPSLRARLAEL
jgi:hypothetical protein